MDTLEHEKAGNGVSITTRDNPYIFQDENHTYLTLMSLAEGIPQPIEGLKLTLGELVAMPDYFTDPNWNMKLDLKPCHQFNSTEDLGKELIRKEVTPAEERALLGALHDLAKPGRKRSSIDTVFKIANAKYFPVDSVNSLIQGLMYFLRVKHFDRKLNTNQTHFTPWSVRVYTIGHTMALDYAEAAYQLKRRATNPLFRSDNPFANEVCIYLEQNDKLDKIALEDYAHRFHAMSIEIEMYTAHYLSDHFAAGHMSQVGDLRVFMPAEYGTLGGIAINTMHNELNRIGVRTKKPYDPEPNVTDPPLKAYGDGDFDLCENTFNREACITSLQHSVADIEGVLDGRARPEPEDFGALNYLPDVDNNSRQPEPMFLLHNDQVYVRGNLKKIRMLGPDDYDRLQADPKAWGYKPLKGKLHLFYILFKLRVLPFYSTKLMSLTEEETDRIQKQENGRQEDREPMPESNCAFKIIPEVREAFFEKDGSPYLRRSKDHSEENIDTAALLNSMT